VIELPEDDINVVSALVQFMYNGDYTINKDIAVNCVEACRLHGDICLAARKYNIKDLPELAELRLTQRAWAAV